MRSFRPAATLAVLMYVVTGWGPQATAETFEYSGAFTFCTTTCNGFSALGGPGGSSNTQPSTTTGTVDIDVGPNGSFTSADITDFSFEVFNPAIPIEVYDGSNPTTANPLPLDPSVAALTGSGTTDASGQLTSGELAFEFTVPPFSSNGAVIYFDLSDGSADGFLFTNIVLFVEIAGDFSLQVLPGDIAVSPTSVDFGDVLEGAATASSTVTVSNDGTGPLTITAVDAAALAPPLAVDSSACLAASPLAPMANCDLTVTLDTATIGDYSGSFAIQTDDPDTASVTVNVSGSVIVPPAPVLALAPASLTFPSTVSGNFAERMVTATNDGDADLIFGVIGAVDTLAAPFQIVMDTCSGATLTPAATCALTIQFMPAMGGMFMDSFDIPSNDAGGSVTYALSGEAVDAPEPQIAADPTSVDFGELLLGDFDTATVTLSNPGTGVLTITSIGVNGDASFSQTNDCGAALAVQASCTVSIVLNGASGGDKNATLDVVSDATLQPNLSVAITATVFEGPRITVDPAMLSIGEPAMPIELGQTGSGSVTVGNEGASDLTITAVSLATSGGMSATEFTLSEDCTAGVLAVGATCTVDLEFAPLTPGDKMTAIIFNSDDPDTPALQVPVTGFVLMGSRAEVSSDTLAIGAGAPGDAIEVGESGSGMFTVTSNGTEDLNVSSIVVGGVHAAEFATMDDCVGMAIPRGALCTVTVTFTPTTAGDRMATVTVFSDSATGDLVVDVTGTGRFPPPPPPPPAPGSQTTEPPAFALGDTGSEGACFIATAAYGSYLDPNVKVLRDFRDDVLLPTQLGRAFVDFYYSNSPVLADFIARHEMLRTVTRWLLTPLVYALAYPMTALASLLALWVMLRMRKAKMA